MNHPRPRARTLAKKRPPGRMKLIELMVLIAGIALLFGIVTMMKTPRPETLRSVCANNLKQIGLALHNYEAAYGCFPPAYVADASGKPMHSWRVLILPYLDQQALYDRYRFDEPWDGPNNRKLHRMAVAVYGCPSDPKRGPATSYLAVLGRETAWPGSNPVRARDITDGLSKTAQVVEVRIDTIHWMEPRDLQLTGMNYQINGDGGVVGPSSLHPDGANSLFADGSVRFLKNPTDAQVLRALLTIGKHDHVYFGSY